MMGNHTSGQGVTGHGLARVVQSFWFVFAVAFALRVIAAVVISVQLDSLIFDDGTYSLMAAEMAAGETERWDAFTHGLYRGTSTLMVPLTALYELFGPVEIVGQLFIALFGAATAYLTARLANEVMPRRWAIAAGLVVALLPSQIAFSSVTLKDPLAWTLLSGIALCLAIAGRSTRNQLLAIGLLIAGQLVLLGYLRRQTLVVAAVAIAITAAAGSVHLRRARAIGGLALGIAIPWLFGMGPLGLAAIPDPGVLSAYRAAQSTGGSAAYEQPKIAGPEEDAPKEEEEEKEEAPVAQEEDAAVRRDLQDLPRGVVVALLEPLPWTENSSGRLLYAKLEMMVWYPLLALALFGAWARRRQVDVIAFPLVASAGLIFVYALAEGNIGTAFRHRGEVVWAAAVVGMLGLKHVAATVRQRETARKMAPSTTSSI